MFHFNAKLYPTKLKFTHSKVIFITSFESKNKFKFKAEYWVGGEEIKTLILYFATKVTKGDMQKSIKHETFPAKYEKEMQTTKICVFSS